MAHDDLLTQVENPKFDFLFMDDECEEESSLELLPWLDHWPAIFKPGHYREAAFAEAWQRYMHSSTIPNLKLWRITHNSFFDPPDQKVATLFSAIFGWLGTNVGSSMVETATRQHQYGGMVLQWGKENLRIPGVDSGLGTMDHLCLQMGWVPENLSVDLFRSTFQLMDFLDSHEGQLLIEYAQARAEAIHE